MELQYFSFDFCSNESDLITAPIRTLSSQTGFIGSTNSIIES